ncbi:MAG: saccharopine dehydrogenase C-terminal domain-containing protein [Flavobacteriaceae bacterium]|jgi:saccharopine dehydrogenase-like NADP-dependent oxidoreductase|nr:saccharopine dehydrogenase C-terminal domain-containing protein [Flavobacteriaceae bacterium]MDG2290813.1 saccharopine dehydrogenase C-terminal domain-containing protein [Flavobacteriaceae bacterium]
MNSVAVLGLGKVGTLVGVLLDKQFSVKGYDLHKPHYEIDIPFPYEIVDISNTDNVHSILDDADAVVSALPYYLNKSIAEIACQKGVHYFDLTEDVKTTQHIQHLKESASAVLAPQCGLAPGFIGIIGGDLSKEFDEIRDIELRVGALPRYPNGQLSYSFTWSPTGVINEYLNDAEVIHNGKRKIVPSLDGFEQINIEGQEYETFTTSGGLGTMCDTFDGKVDTLNYKTIRYPGHGKLMRFLLYELIMKKDLKQLEAILTNAKPPVDDDLVHVYAVVEGKINTKISRKEYFKTYFPKKIGSQMWRAISWTTAASVAAIIELVALGKLPQKGFIKQENISLKDFFNTQNGLYLKH